VSFPKEDQQMEDYPNSAVSQDSQIQLSDLPRGAARRKRKAECRALFAAQARLLAQRAERGLPIDQRSLLHLVNIYSDIDLFGGR
jgi:hypothetical protein